MRLNGDWLFWELVLVDLIPLLVVNSEDVEEHVWEEHVQLVKIQEDVEELIFVAWDPEEVAKQQ